jgi:hypothetical protein
MAEKDDPQIQRARIERIAKEMEPNVVVRFDPDAMPRIIKWRIIHGPSGTVLLESSGEWLSGVIADKTDEELRMLFRSLSNYRLR